MPKKHRKFADDGWAVWIDGDDTSTVYINDWINPKGKSYVDIAVRIRGVKASRRLNVYAPFEVSSEEMEDVTLAFHKTRILQAIFSATCIVDFKKNDHTSEVAYNGKTVDIVHISTLECDITPIYEGTLISVDLEALYPFLDNDEAYFAWRMPHKSLDEIFKPRVTVGSVLTRLRDLILTPIVSEKYGYSIRINESRLLPEQITRIGAFHRQKLRKSVIVISVDENYEINDAGCNRIRRLEENLYEDYLPAGYTREDVIMYQWEQNRVHSLKGHFNFYYSISKNTISSQSMLIYTAILLIVGVLGNLLADVVRYLIELL